MLPGDLNHNYRALLVWKRLLHKETATDAEIADIEPNIRMHISKFTIMSEGYADISAHVEAGKYKTAMFLLYLAWLHKSSSFRMDIESQALVTQYFTAEVINDALSNPQTTHHSVRTLLATGFVQVNCLL